MAEEAKEKRSRGMSGRKAILLASAAVGVFAATPNASVAAVEPYPLAASAEARFKTAQLNGSVPSTAAPVPVSYATAAIGTISDSDVSDDGAPYEAIGGGGDAVAHAMTDTPIAAPVAVDTTAIVAPAAPDFATPVQTVVPGTQVIQIVPPVRVARLNTSGRVMQIVAPLNDRENYLGDVEIRVELDDSVEVSAEQVLAILNKFADASDLEALRASATSGAFFPAAKYAEYGFPITFNATALSLNINIPANSRIRQSIGLADLDRSTYGEFATPSKITAYLNLRSSVDYVHKGQNTGFGDTLILMDSAARFGGVVMENEGSWRSEDNGFSREGTRFVYDDFRNLNRWVGGDLLPQARGFQGVQDMAGFSVERTYSLLDPQRNITPRGGRSFTLDRESTVEAYINGRVARTLRLQPGSYDLNDFPFVQGSNDVELVISDESGRREVLSFSVFIDRTQLAPGLSEYGLYAGVKSERLNDRINYSSDPTASGFYRRGVSENLTLGGNFQYAQNGSVAGVEGVWGSGWGTLGGDFAVSQLDVGGTGWATNLSFERLVQSAGGGTSITATVEARSRRFGAPSQVAPDNRYLVNAVVAYNRSLGDSSFFGGQLRYAKAREGFEDESTVRVSYGRRLSASSNVVVDTDWTSGGFADGVGLRIGLVRRFGNTGSARAEYDTRNERGRVGYQTSGGRGVGAWSGAGTLEGGSDDFAFNGSAAYAANRADLGIAHNTGYSLTSNDIVDQRTSLRGATAIAFADGAFAIGRPVSDGFAIVRPYKPSSDLSIEVEPSAEGYYARSGLLGPALYGQVGSYSPRSVIYDAPNAPLGFDIGSGSTRVLAPYKAGYLITVGSDYGVTAIGRLLNESGEPVTFLSGHAIEQGSENRRIDVITNRQGTFGVSGLKAGRWKIEMLGDTAYELIVPESPDGIARVGDLRPIR